MGNDQKKRSKKTGLPPGALIHIGDRKRENVVITFIDYDETQILEKRLETINECFVLKAKPTVTWINVSGLHRVEIVEKLGECFGIHPLILEDILTTGQRPKAQDLGEYLFIVLRMLSFDGVNILDEQVSLLLGENFVISFQENGSDVFDPLRERIRSGKGRIRKMGADYLAYSLLDAVVDHYFVVLEKLGEKMDAFEDSITGDPLPGTLQSIHNLRRELTFVRKSIWPLREVISFLEKLESNLIQNSTFIYLRDVYDHTIQIIDTVETYRDIISEMVDTYLTSIGNRTNKIMKVLTIIATIFIPLTFMAGVYGMNFKHMPELEWRYGYFGALLLMLTVGVTMLTYFKKQKWF